jgi:hypothetical protein
MGIFRSSRLPDWKWFLGALLGGVLPAGSQADGIVNLPGFPVYSSRVANQSSAAAFATPVSALRYEPRVDIYGRNFAEGQADITIRGGIFENTGLQVGAVTLGDPQTGHYLAEVPVAPAMLGALRVVTGADLALGASNATVGALAYTWRPVRTGGAATVSLGENSLRMAEFYQGFSRVPAGVAGRLGVDVALAHSKSDGAIPFGDHDFSRANLRFQHSAAATQTDLFAGYQSKRLGWPNLYTPFNSNEAENLQTSLLLLNHRVDLGADESIEVGVFQRRNKDDYAFNRFAAVGPVHPFQHTTWLSGGAVSARQLWGGVAVDLRAEVQADRLESTSLTAGRYHTRTLTKAAILAGKNWKTADSGRVVVRAGIMHDDTNRDTGSFSPVVEIAREFASARLQRVYLSFTQTSQVPTYTALNSSATTGLFRGNPNLGRSASRNFEFGGAGSVLGWATEAALFHRRDRALVDWTFRGGVTARTANPMDVEVSGLEVVARRSWAACDVVVGYTAMSKVADYRGAAVDASFYALNYARHRLTAALTVRLGRGIELRIDNAARLQATNILRVVGGDDALATAVGLIFRPSTVRGLELSLRVDNVWNALFQEIPAVPASPRQVSAAAGYMW